MAACTSQTDAGDQLARRVDEGSDADDGRRRRRRQNRDAVVGALLDLYAEGNLSPSTDEITARAGVSSRSLFRYFDDVDDLAGTAIALAHQRIEPLLAIGATPKDEFAVRVAALVSQRSRLFEAVESTALVTRLRAPFNHVVAANLAGARAHLRLQLAELFEHEVGALAPEIAASRLAAADVATSFEAYRLLRDDQGLSRRRAGNVLADTLTTLLQPRGDL